MIFFKKKDTFWKHPIESARIRFDKVYMRSIIEWWSKARLRREGLFDIIEAFHKNRPPASYKPVFADLWFLYRMVRKRKPRIVWEFGSGCSTLVLSYALWKNLKEGVAGFMYCIEEDEFWGNSTISLTPGFLLPFYKLIHSPVAKGMNNGLRHTVLPKAVPDFVYLDGPGHQFYPQIAIDLLDIEQKLPKKFFLIVDCRRDNVRFLRERFKRRYKFWRRRFIPQYMFELVE